MGGFVAAGTALAALIAAGVWLACSLDAIQHNVEACARKSGRGEPAEGGPQKKMMIALDSVRGPSADRRSLRRRRAAGPRERRSARLK